MRERPILFSAPMVRAILAGAKTQTRRVVTPQPAAVSAPVGGAPGLIRSRASDPCLSTHESACPYGAPGDRLWVRETFSPYRGSSDPASIADAEYVVLRDGAHVLRRSGEAIPGLPTYADGAFDPIRWRPSIHMPRWASRITLEITSVRVERLTAISEDDARAEGVDGVAPRCAVVGDCAASFRGAFAVLWDAINGERPGCAWAVDPWVWVIGFKRASAGGGV